MFEAWGRRMYRWRWSVLALSALLFAASLVVALRGGRLTTGTVAGTESRVALDVIEHELGQATGSSFTVIFHNDALTVDDDGFRDAVTAALAPVRTNRHVARVQTPYDTPEPIARTLVSSDRHRAVAQVDLREETAEAVELYPSVRELIHAPSLAPVFTGPLAIASDLDHILERDLRRAELVSIPLALIVLVLVFGTLVASLTPLGVGGLAVLGGVAGVFLLSRTTSVAQYALNIVTLIGLGVAIDYSLFIVKRHQEELDRGASVQDALAYAMNTAGRAVAFSGLAVAIGLSGLLFYRGSYLSSIGIAGAIVVALAVLYALTFLPALLGVLGHAVNKGRIWRPNPAANGGWWHKLAHWVMARPVLVLLPTLAFMLAAGAPFLRIQLAAADVHVLPRSAEARRGDELLTQYFPEQAQPRIVVISRFPTAPAFTAARAGAVFDLGRRIAALPHVERVDSVVDFDPSMTRETAEQLVDAPRDALPPELVAALGMAVGPHIIALSVVLQPDTTREQAQGVVRAVRAIHRVGDGELLVTGRAAIDLDVKNFVVEKTPWAIAFVMLMTYLVLFFSLGSVVLPLKAVVMNLLSITGSFGALVWIFQEGHLSKLLGFTPGPIDPSLPVILFCTVFGLSMDYEVLLLSRMREEYARTGDNTHSVAEGLERSGRLITSAAAIMVAVFLAFSLADVVLIKAVGLGMAVAITLDATVVRVLIVPATMRLFGDVNWWMPKALERFVAPARAHD